MKSLKCSSVVQIIKSLNSDYYKEDESLQLCPTINKFSFESISNLLVRSGFAITGGFFENSRLPVSDLVCESLSQLAKSSGLDHENILKNLRIDKFVIVARVVN